MELNHIYNMDCMEGMKQLSDNSVDCCITSPPYYGLRDYGVDGQIGLEDTPEQYIARLVDVFREVRRVLKPTGTLWLNLGDSYCGTGSKGDYKDPKYTDGRNGQSVSLTQKIDGLKPKDLIGIPWRVALALQADGWWLRQDIIWHKPNPMPESVTDRCTKAHEYIFLMSKSAQYYFDHESIQETAVTQYREREKNNGESAVDTKKRGHGCVCGTTQKSTFGNRNGELDKLHSGNTWEPQHKNLSYDGQTPNTIHIARAEGKEEKGFIVRNKRSVWRVATTPYSGAHFATFPEKLIEPCVLAGCPKDGIILDPFMGAGTTALVATRHYRHYIGFEINPEYCKLIDKRLSEVQLKFA